MRIRFPFLIVKAKGLSLNRALVGAQNQAAVSGACMLSILQDLRSEADGCNDTAASTEAVVENTTALCFSITIEGAVHEMKVYFMHEGSFHMHCS